MARTIAARDDFGTVTSGTTSKDKARLCLMIPDPTQTTTIEDGSSIRALPEGPTRSKTSRLAPSKKPLKRERGGRPGPLKSGLRIQME